MTDEKQGARSARAIAEGRAQALAWLRPYLRHTEECAALDVPNYNDDVSNGPIDPPPCDCGLDNQLRCLAGTAP